MRKVVLLPHLGEFGWFIMQHVRWAHWIRADEKVVCCESGHECLFPTASSFYVDWKNPISPNERWGNTSYGDRGATSRYYQHLRESLSAAFPEHEVLTPQPVCHWHMSDAWEWYLRPIAAHRLPAPDVVLGARARGFDGSRNWSHWLTLANVIASRGLRLGVVGRKDSTVDIPDSVAAWDHPEGDTAGCVDLLSHCKLYIGVDSGMSHLAAMIGCPMIVIYAPHQPARECMVPIMERANKGKVRTISGTLWNLADAAISEILPSLETIWRLER